MLKLKMSVEEERRENEIYNGSKVNIQTESKVVKNESD